jgi:polyferredoxin
MKDITRKEILSTSSTTLTKFGIILGSFIAILFGFIPWIIHSKTVSPFVWLLAIFTYIIAFLQPLFLRLPYFLWMKLGYYLGLVQNTIVLAVIFYIIVYPTGIIMSFFKHKPIADKPDTKLLSYRIISQRNHKNMEKPY